ncbi:ubiquitin-like-conjugating enzyme ATG10 [Euwallacea fornicatus]|uniref:ubiquitin-like-conjugating enzyme ATG10 n=1 Tax=Euwallacea fornicatus TaxID=995702 RepID=UPI00338FF80B
MSSINFSYDLFVKCIEEIIEISSSLLDGWTLNEKQNCDNGKYITKKSTVSLNHTIVIFEYHIAFHISYNVPVLCVNVWKSDGSLLTMEEVWNLSSCPNSLNMYETLTQMDHPVLCQPILMLHPCKTQEILRGFMQKSKNPVVSWLSIASHFVHLRLLNEYINCCF